MKAFYAWHPYSRMIRSKFKIVLTLKFHHWHHQNISKYIKVNIFLSAEDKALNFNVFISQYGTSVSVATEFHDG
jgi:hypothetical protein